MGEYFVNYQIKSDLMGDAIDKVSYLTRTRAYLSPPKNGWITVYDLTSDLELKYDEIRNFAQKISAELSTIVLTIIVFSGVHFLYFLDDSGELVDEFYDRPTTGFEFGFIKANKAVVQRFRGHPEKLIDYSHSGTTIESISAFLKSCQEGKVDYLGDGGARHFAQLFGIDEYRATNGYNYFEKYSLNEKDPDLEDAESFLLVSRTTSEKNLK